MKIETQFGPAWASFREDGALTAFTLGREVEDNGFVNAEAMCQIEEYFAGTRRDFTMPLAPKGTAFQQEVWKELLRIPYGETISYGELAQRLGRPTAFRAVGGANGSNPIAVIVPCHRVIGSDGSLTGYGHGVDMKRRLLEFETGRSWERNLQLSLL